jgi:hypothetical protein
MVLAYWMIGREIVEEVQEGEKRAEYGKQVIEKLSEQLTDKFGKGFSAPTLWNFRQFYQTYSQREPIILSRSGRESTPTPEMLDTVSQEILSLTGRELTVAADKEGPIKIVANIVNILLFPITVARLNQTEVPLFLRWYSFSHFLTEIFESTIRPL